ncbi:MAG: PAC2 family protein [Phycisphaeraceae bacterium]
MAEHYELENPWLVAVWPGMGNVSLAAGNYLARKLGARLIGELPAKELFDVEHIDVKDGIASPSRMPRNLFFAWKNPAGGQDIVFFIGEAQPSTRGYEFCQRLLDYAEDLGVQRVFTFAAMATQLHPSDAPRVFGVATRPDLLGELSQQPNVEVLREGQISGLNGVLPGAAAERGMEGLCLLGELPFFAVGVPNPRASQAVLEVFATMAGIDVDVTELAEQAKAVEQHLLQLMQRLGEATEQSIESEEEFTIPGVARQQEEDEDEEEDESKLDLAARQRIERLFEKARQDRSKAMELKRELDRLGVFKDYEDRFLDLFRKGG